MKAGALAAALAFAFAAAGAARAEPAPPRPPPRASPPHRHALSLYPLALVQRGVEVQYEHFVAPPRWSVATKLGLRDGASDDFDGVTFMSAVEGRFWVDGLRHRDMRGLFIAPRVVASTAHLSYAETGRSLGSTLTFAGVFGGGYRFVAWDFLEITPTAGFGLAVDVDSRARTSAWWRAVATAGLTTGVIF